MADGSIKKAKDIKVNENIIAWDDDNKSYNMISEISQVKTRLVDKKTNQMLLRVDEDDHCKRVKNNTITKLGDYDAVVISDYDKGFLTESTIKYLIHKYPMTFIDSKKLFNKWINGVTFLKINEVEYNRNRKNLKDYKGNLIVTLGEKGVDFNGTIIPPKRQAEVSDLSGAGDTFFAAFVCGILKNKGIKSSIDFAQDCALSVIEKKGVVII
jgi:bifunctional ADP-heptose synthase (sugar kinase/adenylyltransferase)